MNRAFRGYGVLLISVHFLFFWLVQSLSKAHENACTILQSVYVPSLVEIASARSSDRWNYAYCEQYQAETSTRITVLNITARVRQFRSNGRRSCKRTHGTPHPYLSFFERQIQCSGAKFNTSQYIEPIYAIFRHPDTITCPDLGRAKRKKNLGYLIIEDSTTEHVQSAPQRIYLDLGASSYAGISQRWLLKQYKQRGIQFDRILLWEVTKHSNTFDNLPPRFFKAYQFFNTPAIDAEDDERNPLNIIRAIATSGDFVVFKLDIDNPSAEYNFIQQIINSTDLPKLIDELYWEPQFAFQPMIDCCWHDRASNFSVRTIHGLFTSLRHLGKRPKKTHKQPRSMRRRSPSPFEAEYGPEAGPAARRLAAHGVDATLPMRTASRPGLHRQPQQHVCV